MISFAGHLRLRAAARDNARTTLAEQSFRAPFHLSKPYWDSEARTLLVQVVNPTAGILSGDRLESHIAVDENATLLVTTPSASRVFTMREGTAECRQHFSVARNGWLEVSPEPLVPHRGACYRQTTTIDVAAKGALFFVDQLMPGRVGHGEAWSWTDLRLELDVRYDNTLILRERFAHNGVDLLRLAELNRSGSKACFANAVLIGGDLNANAPWRVEIDGLNHELVWVGVSALRHAGWSLKLIARDAVTLRQTLRDVRLILAPYFPALQCDARKL